MSYFMNVKPFIEGNSKLRDPQIEAYMKIKEYFIDNPGGEALVVLPTGTGKSGLVSIAPYGISKGRVLVITPGLVTKKSIIKTLHPMEENFWLNYDIIFDPEDMPVVEEYDSEMLQDSLEKCDFVITNVHKLYKDKSNSLLNRVSNDFFDMIIVDEAHHSVAETWVNALEYFKKAKKLHVTGTPYRGDGIPIPGELIHTTKLSEVMALKYVKWLRKRTVNNSKLYFTIPGDSNTYSRNEVLQLKDKEWVQRSVALSKECSLEVITESIKQLDDLKEASPNVPHKILAVACSIPHAEDVARWYTENQKRVVIVHSKMDKEEIDQKFQIIEDNGCDVVVSVNMLMEGYDHKYLTILALFRPYRSLNAFAQVVGRVLRAIPDNEIKEFAIDNNAVIIYHQETGLDTMWNHFSKEIEKSKKIKVKEYNFSDREYTKREIIYADIDTDEYFIDNKESYLDTIDFNKLYEEARNKIDQELQDKITEWKVKGLSDEEIDMFAATYKKKLITPQKSEVDRLLIEKRPELARKKARDILYKNANDAAQDILQEKNIDPKGISLYDKFKKLIYRLNPSTPNDGILVRYINDRVFKRFGPVKQRKPEVLLLSEKYMNEVVDELRRML
ncbi:DEAD/DEAH box helicase family protein [Clostridium sporogenes]